MKFSITIVAALLSATSMAAPANEVSMMAASPSGQFSPSTASATSPTPPAPGTSRSTLAAAPLPLASTSSSQPRRPRHPRPTAGLLPAATSPSPLAGASKKQIVYPAYTDQQLAGGKVVKPDQAYAPASLP
ncbi:hypothetical protein NW754_002476 [Fusarium falciforme]|nr:hypothetical protein NW754_002476 [Fusarium falciforme]